MGAESFPVLFFYNEAGRGSEATASYTMVGLVGMTATLFPLNPKPKPYEP